MSIPIEEANDIAKVLVDAPLVGCDKDACMKLVEEKAEAGEAAPAAGGDGRQIVDMPYLWLTSGDWDVMTNPDASLHQRVSVLARRFIGLGLYFPDEHAAKNVVAVALTDQGDPDSLLNVSLRCQDIFKRFVKPRRASRPLGRELPQFTLQPSVFKEKYADWYAEGYKAGEEPAKLPVDLERLRWLMASCPCRKSKTGVAGPPKSSMLSFANKHPAQASLEQLASMLNLRTQHAVGEDCLPGLQLFTPSRVGARQLVLATPAAAAAASAPAYPPAPGPLALPAPAPAPPPAATPAAAAADGAPALAPATPAAAATVGAPALGPLASSAPTPEAPESMVQGMKAMLVLSKEGKGEEALAVVKKRPGALAVLDIAVVKKRPSAGASGKGIRKTVLKKPAAGIASSGCPLKKKAGPEKVPKGWRVEKRVRKDGVSAGTVDFYYTSPDGKRCRSLREVHAYAGKA